MQKMETETGEKNRKQGGLSGWLRLAAGLAMIWAMAYVILPWGSTLPVIAPIMKAIADSEIDTGAYWYTQSEETAIAQMYVRHAIDGRRD